MFASVRASATVAALLLLLYLGCSDAALIQNGITYANADFSVTFYDYNITGFVNITVFDTQQFCKIVPSSLVPGGIMVVYWPDAILAGCGISQEFVYALSQAVSDPSQLPAIMIYAQNFDDEYADDWQLAFANEQPGLFLTSIRGSVWSQLSFDLPITITPGPNPWQTMFLSSGTRARYIFFACLWSVMSLLFLCVVVDIIITLTTTNKAARTLWVELSVSGLLFSLITAITYAYSAALSFQNSNLSEDVRYALFAFSDVPLTVSVYSVCIKWLRLCGETRKLPGNVVKINTYILMFTMVAVATLLITFGAYLLSRSFPGAYDFYVSCITIFVFGLITTIIIIAYCFIKIWASIAHSFRETGRGARIWKLAFVSIASVSTLALILIFVGVTVYGISSVASYVTIDIIKALCPLPMLTSWLSLSSLWSNLNNMTHGSSTGRTGSESETENKRTSNLSVGNLSNPETSEELKPAVYSVGEINVTF